jgi:hypothetical protein
MKVSWSSCPFGFDHLADEADCYVFYHCFSSPWGTVMIPKTCGPFLMFNPGAKLTPALKTKPCSLTGKA